MSKYLFYPIIFLLSVIQAAFLPINLVLMTLVLWWGFAGSAVEVFIWSFVAGLFLDLARGTTLGLSSLIFMIFSLFFYLYRRRFDYRIPWLMAIYVVIMDVIFEKISVGSFWLVRLVILGIITLVIAFVLNNFWAWESQKGKGIKLKN
jgi:cell shape-determining protein MreD